MLKPNTETAATTMRIVIDMQGAQSEFSGQRGVGRYTLALAKAIERVNEQHEIIYAFNGFFEQAIDRIVREMGPGVPASRIKSWQQFCAFTGNDTRSDPSRLAAEIVRETFLSSLAPDVVFSTNLQEGLGEPAATSIGTVPTTAITCTTLHDVIPLTQPETFLADPVTRVWYEKKIADACKSDLVITDSPASEADIIKYLGLDEERLQVIPLGVDTTHFSPLALSEHEIEAIRRKFGIESGFVLYVGGNDYHKNLDRLFAAYARLPEATRKQYRLVLVGKELAFQRQQLQNKFVELEIQHDVTVAGRAEEHELIALLNMTDLFVFPSLHEGFGLPVLEAMACGAPIIASNAPSVKEILGNTEALFDPYDVDAIHSRLEMALSDAEFRSRSSRQGLLRSANFSWDESARKLLRLLEQQYARRQPQKTRDIELDETQQWPQDTASEHPSEDDWASTCVSHVTRMNRAAELHETDLKLIAKAIAATFRPGDVNQRNLLIDISTVIQKDHGTGIQRVVRAIGSELLKLKSQNVSVHLVYSRADSQKFRRATAVEAKWNGEPLDPELSSETVELHDGDMLVYLDLHPGVAISHRATVAKLRRRGVRVLHVVYDLLPMLRPEYFWPELCSEFSEWLRTVASSDGALCISQSVAQELDQWLVSNAVTRGYRFKIHWFHLGGDIANSAPSAGLPNNAGEVLQRLRSGTTFLMVGTVEPRKGHKQVLEACECLWRDGINVNLVVVGNEGWRNGEVVQRLRTHSLLGKRLFWLEGISDEYLEMVYAGSSCLIAASMGEGFGLPLIEGARHKLPIIARDIPVFREVVGEHAFFFDSTEPADLATALVEWLALYKSGEHPQPTGISWLTWQESARRLMHIVMDNDPSLVREPAAASAGRADVASTA